MRKHLTFRTFAMTTGLVSIMACGPFCNDDNNTTSFVYRTAAIQYTGVNTSTVDCHISVLPDGMSESNRVNAGTTRSLLFSSTRDFSFSQTMRVTFVAQNPGGQLATGQVDVNYTQLTQGRTYRVTYNGTANLTITPE